MQGAAVLVGRGHVGAEARLRLNRVRQWEVGRELLRLRGAQVEVAAGGSVRMLRPLKGGTWRGKDREDAMRARTAPLLHRPPPPPTTPPRGHLQLAKLKTFIRTQRRHQFYIRMGIFNNAK